MIIIYIRHGEPTYEPDGLTELGMQQAEEVAKHLSIKGVDKIFSSTSKSKVASRVFGMILN